MICSDTMARDRWTALPTDILILVLNLVSFHDLVRLTALCKTWRQPVLDDLRQRHQNLPWLISFNQGKFKKLDLIDPWLNKSFSLVETIKRDGVRNLLLDYNVHASKDGWLLMSKKIGLGIISFSFYNPFRNKIISIQPPLDLNNKSRQQSSKAMFSTSPTSPDCVIFVMSQGVIARKGDKVKFGYRLSTYKDRKWTSIPISHRDSWEGNWVRGLRDVIYIDGKFYCMFKDYWNPYSPSRRSYDELGIFNVALEEWSIEQYDCGRHMEYKTLIEFDGELLMAASSDIWEIGFSIWQFDRSEKTWKRIKSLGDRVLFLNQKSRSSSSMAAVGETKEFANMIVYLEPLFDEIITYTCKDDQGEWTPHQRRNQFGLNESTFWIDVPNFSNLNL